MLNLVNMIITKILNQIVNIKIVSLRVNSHFPLHINHV